MPGNTGKMTSNSCFKVRFSESFLDPVRGFQLEFDVIWEVRLPWVLICSKIRHCKAMNIGKNDGKMTSFNNFKVKFSEMSLDVVRVFGFFNFV